MDVARKRIALSMRIDDEVTPEDSAKKSNGKANNASKSKPQGGAKPSQKHGKPQNRQPARAPKPQAKGSMAALFEKALNKP